MDDRVPEPWHKLHDEEYETAVAEGVGAMVGTCMGMGEDPPFMTDALHRGLRYMAASCFDRGYQTNRDEDHDCTTLAAAEARGRQQAEPVIDAARAVVRATPAEWLKSMLVLTAALDALDSIAKEGRRDGD